MSWGRGSWILGRIGGVRFLKMKDSVCVYIYIYMYGKHGVAFLLGNFCLVLGISSWWKWTATCFQGTYCWWTKSCTTWDGWNPINNGIIIILGGAGFCPSTVSLYIYMYIYIVGKEKTKKLFRLKVEGCFFFRFRRGFLFFKNWNPSRIEKKTDTETFQAVLYGSYGPPTKLKSRAFTKG